MFRARDFDTNEGMEISEYFVYFGIFIPLSWGKRSARNAKGEFFEVLKKRGGYPAPFAYVRN